MAGPEWTTVVDGVRYTWPEVVRKIGDGAWTLERAVVYTGMGYQALKMRIAMTARTAGDWALRKAAERALQQMSVQAAAAAGGGGAAAGGVATSRGVLGLLRAIGLRLGLTGAAATATGAVLVTAALAGVVYIGSQVAGEMAADRPSAQLGPTATRRACPPRVMHKTMCPWGPQSPTYFVAECGPGWCYDGGGHGTGACKQTTAPPGARRTYTRDLLCPDGTKAVVDPCTEVLRACTPS